MSEKKKYREFGVVWSDKYCGQKGSQYITGYAFDSPYPEPPENWESYALIERQALTDLEAKCEGLVKLVEEYIGGGCIMDAENLTEAIQDFISWQQGGEK